MIIAVVTACGSSSPSVVHPPSSGGVPTSSPVVTSSHPSGPPSHSKPGIRIAPSSGLHDGQQVQVRGTGFTPGESLQVVECLAKGNATGPGDCNLSGMLPATADSNGQVNVRLKVVQGPFGAHRVSCSTHTPCLVSITQATLTPTEEADAPIAFKP